MKQLMIAFMALTFVGFYSCDINKTKSGELPTVDVETEAGTLPEYEVDWVDINVGTKTKTITVPTVEIVMEEKEVEVPFIDATWPKEYDNVAEQTIAVEAEVTGHEYELEIDEVFATNDKLIVISSLEKEDQVIGEKAMRVSDQIVINAPDVTVKHYIVGDKPSRGFNNNYTYISNKSEISSRLKNAKKIYG